MKPHSAMDQGEVAALVASHLRSRGIDVILCGGACVSLHAEGDYVSLDLDFVDNGYTRRSRIGDALSEIGFTEEGRYFRHPDIEFPVEFLPGPPMVGEERPGEISERPFETGTLRLLSPTDCIKDRLTWYYYDSDRQALEQAVLVARKNPIDPRELRRWSEHEGKLAEYLGIEHRLKPAGEKV